MTMISHSSLATAITIPVVSALIGYVTNYIAVKMLFRPHSPRRVLGLTFHGLVPKRQKQIAVNLGRMIERDLISHKDIEAVLRSSTTTSEATSFMNEQVDAFVAKFVAQNPMVGVFLQGPIIDQVKTLLVGQMTERLPEFTERIVSRVEEGLDIKETIREKIEGFDLTKLEGMIQEVSAKELKTIEVLGGVLGFFVGLVQVGLFVALEGQW
jgi:uncharacterized membrane protein YheB (UPF0754 family)